MERDRTMVLAAQATTDMTLRDSRLDVGAVTLHTGVTLPYVQQGNARGLPVIFLHGYSDSWRSWEPILPTLPGSIRAIVPTQRGHGDAERPRTGYGVRDFAADVKAFVAALGLDRAVIVGHSLGSAVAQRFAIDHPGRTRGLVLIGAATTWKGNRVITELWEDAIATLSDPVDPAFVRAFQESPRLAPERLDAVVAESLKMPARIWREAWQGIMSVDFSADLGRIKAPTLIVWGEEDPLCPRHEQVALLGAIADSRLVTYPGCGHNLHWEEPERFAGDLMAFVGGLSV